MARPIKYYVQYEYGRAIGIVHGNELARKLKCDYSPFKTEAAAEEAAAWHNYMRDIDSVASSRILSPSTEQTTYHRSRRLWAYPSGGYRWAETYTHFVAHPVGLT